MASPEQKTKSIKYARFAFGLIIFLWLFLVAPTLANQDFFTAVMFYFLTPLAFLAIPSMAIGIYFLATAKMRVRLDIIVVILLILCLFNLERMMMRENISGGAELQVTVTREDGLGVANLEVDLGKQAGQPPEGGVENTDENGVATFKIKPGDYVIYFNMGNFPADLFPPPEPILIKAEEDGLNSKTVILKSK